MTDISTTFRSDINALSGNAPLVLLRIDHEALATPVRLAQDTVNWGSTAGGTTRNLYVGMAFRISLPDQFAEQLPKATLEVDNVGRDLTRWIEATGGGQGATCTIFLVSRRSPNRVERAVTMGLGNLVITQTAISGDLSFDNLLDRPATRLHYRPDTAPGVF